MKNISSEIDFILQIERGNSKNLEKKLKLRLIFHKIFQKLG